MKKVCYWLAFLVETIFGVFFVDISYENSLYVELGLEMPLPHLLDLISLAAIMVMLAWFFTWLFYEDANNNE